MLDLLNIARTEADGGDSATTSGTLTVTVAENQVITGGHGDDTLQGGIGDDVIEGGEGADILEGGAGADMIAGGGGDDTITGGLGDDTLVGGGGDDLLLFEMGDGSDMVDGGIGDTDVLHLENVGDFGLDWTISFDTGSEIAQQSAGLLELSQDASGTISLSDGSEIAFEGIEAIEF